MKYKDIKNMSKADLEKNMSELRLELMKDYAQISAGTPPKNPGMIKERKKTIARIKTFLQNQEGVKKQ